MGRIVGIRFLTSFFSKISSLVIEIWRSLSGGQLKERGLKARASSSPQEPLHLYVVPRASEEANGLEDAIRNDELRTIEKLVTENSNGRSPVMIEQWIFTALRLGSRRAISFLEENGAHWPRKPELIGPLIELHLKDQNVAFATYLLKEVIVEYKKLKRLDEIEPWIFGQLLSFSSAADAFDILVDLGFFLSSAQT